MNKLIIKSLLLLLPIISGKVYAQEEDKINYVVSTVKVQQMTPILLAARALAEEDGDQFGNFELIIYGETVKDLKDEAKMEKWIQQANQANVKLKVCQIALDHYGVSLSDIPSEFQPVKNAFTDLLQLKKSGYLSIEL